MHAYVVINFIILLAREGWRLGTPGMGYRKFPVRILEGILFIYYKNYKNVLHKYHCDLL